MPRAEAKSEDLMPNEGREGRSEASVAVSSTSHGACGFMPLYATRVACIELWRHQVRVHDVRVDEDLAASRCTAWLSASVRSRLCPLILFRAARAGLGDKTPVPLAMRGRPVYGSTASRHRGYLWRSSVVFRGVPGCYQERRRRGWGGTGVRAPGGPW